MKKRILILGAGIMQGPALKIARQLDFETIAVDGNPDAPCKKLAGRFEHIDLKDKDAILRFAEALKAEAAGLAGIMTAGTDFSASVAYAAEKLGLTGIPYETALDASDKERMRRRFAAAKVPSPAFIVLDKTPSPELHLPFAFPAVVKPVDNMGARGCRRVDTAGELTSAVNDALAFSRSSRAIIEEYMDGPEFSVDAIVYQGEITFCGLAARHIFYPPFFIEMGHTMPAEIPQDEQRAILDVFAAGIRALGITNGAAKGDIKLTPGGPMIGEIAARLSGGYMSGWTYPYASGAEPTRGARLVAAGLPPEGITPVQDWVSAERAFISIPGTIHAIKGAESAENLTGVKDFFLRVKTGDKVTFPRNNVEKCGNVISAAAVRRDAEQAAEQAARLILIELAAPDEQTGAFLAGPLETVFPPSAFRPDAGIKNALEKLPPDKLTCAPSVCPFPAFTGSGLLDYAGRTPAESLDAVRLLTGLPLIEDGTGNAALGRGFWRAMLRGGYQGAAYFIRRTLKEQV